MRPFQAIQLVWLIRDVNAYLALDLNASQQLTCATYYNVSYDGLILLVLSVVARANEVRLIRYTSLL